MNSTSSVVTFYDVLEISSTATLAQIRSAFKKAVLQFHPDKLMILEKEGKLTSAQKEESIVKFQKCVAAANCLLDPQSRSFYDSFALGKQMVDITGRISETCSLKEDFEKSSCHDADGDDDDVEDENAEDGATTVSILFTRECRCGGIFSVIWGPAGREQQEDEKGNEAQSTKKKKKYSTCDSCSLVVEVICDV